MRARALLLCFSVVAVSAACGDREQTKAADENAPPQPFAVDSPQDLSPTGMGLPSTAAAPPGTVGDGSTSTKVGLRIHDRKMTLAQTVIPAGPVTIQFKNSDGEKHSIEIFYEVEKVRWRSVPIGKGGFVDMGQSFTPGPYKIYCQVPGHRERGEETAFTVR